MANKICCECGDKGVEKELVYCMECTQVWRHSYCMDIPPENKGCIIWYLCHICEPKPKKQKKPLPHPTLVPAKKPKKHENQPLSVTNSSLGPFVRLVWTGALDVALDETSFVRMEGFQAFLSTRANARAARMATMLEPVVEVEMLPRFLLWPEDFELSIPTDDSIGMYFLASEEGYDALVEEMVRDSAAMRALQHDGSELLIFASNLLPIKSSMYEGRFFLWGFCT